MSPAVTWGGGVPAGLPLGSRWAHPGSCLPASLRVSSVSVVKSDHASVCVSWKPSSAADGYRVLIQSLKGETRLQQPPTTTQVCFPPLWCHRL